MTEQTKVYGSTQMISVAMRKELTDGVLDDFIATNLLRKAESEGYRAIEKPEVIWNERAFKYPDEEGSMAIPCDPEDESAFYRVACRIKVMLDERLVEEMRWREEMKAVNK